MWVLLAQQLNYRWSGQSSGVTCVQKITVPSLEMFYLFFQKCHMETTRSLSSWFSKLTGILRRRQNPILCVSLLVFKATDLGWGRQITRPSLVTYGCGQFARLQRMTHCGFYCLWAGKWLRALKDAPKSGNIRCPVGLWRDEMNQGLGSHMSCSAIIDRWSSQCPRWRQVLLRGSFLAVEVVLTKWPILVWHTCSTSAFWGEES